jgi:DNA-binding transcriptional MerR regulator
METTTPALIRKKELAQRLSVSPRTIDNWVSRRVIPYIQLSSRFNLYDPEAVIEALRKTYQIEAIG